MNLPFSEDAERALLSCALHGLEAAKPICAKVGFAWFYIPAHQSVFAAIEELVNSASPVDWHTVLNGLAGQIEEIGGKEWLSSLFGVVPSPDNFEHYAAIVLDCYDRRRLILNCQQAINAARDGDADSAFHALTVKRTQTDDDRADLVSGKDLMLEVNDFLEGIQDGKIEDKPMRWGIPAVETICDGARDGEFVLIGGESSHGKTALFCSVIALGLICGRTNNPYIQPGNGQGPDGQKAFKYNLQDTPKKAYNGAVNE